MITLLDLQDWHLRETLRLANNNNFIQSFSNLEGSSKTEWKAVNAFPNKQCLAVKVPSLPIELTLISA